MAGGPSTVALATAVSEAGGMGFLASGYGRTGKLREQIHALRSATAAPFGVNLFVPGREDFDRAAVTGYLRQLAPEAERYGTSLVEPRNDEDDWVDFLGVLTDERPPAGLVRVRLPDGGRGGTPARPRDLRLGDGDRSERSGDRSAAGSRRGDRSGQ